MRNKSGAADKYEAGPATYERAMNKTTFLIIAICASLFIILLPANAADHFNDTKYPAAAEFTALTGARVEKLLENFSSPLLRQYILRSYSNGAAPLKPLEQKTGAELFEKMRESSGAGFPLFVSSRSFEETDVIKGGAVVLKALPPEYSAVEVRVPVKKEIFQKIDIRGFEKAPLEMRYFRRGEKGALREAGTAFTIPRTFLKKYADGATVYFVEDNIENPYDDRCSIYAYIKCERPENFQTAFFGLLEKLNDMGVVIKIEKNLFSNLYINETARPQKFLNEIYTKGADLRNARGGADRGAGLSDPNGFNSIKNLYLSTFIMPRKTAAASAPEDAAATLANLLKHGYLASLRARAVSSLGKPVASYHLDIGNESRVFLSYGPGITYKDRGAPLMIFSPAPAFIESTELLDRDSFYFKSRIKARDPLSEAWYSAVDDESRELGRDLRAAIDSFIKDNGLGTFNGRISYFKKLDAIFAREGLSYKKSLASALCEEFNNEVKVEDILSVEKFAECLIVPGKLRKKILETLEKEGIKKVAGLPAGRFVISAIEIKGAENCANLDYITYFLRECRAPEYLAIKKAEAENDIYAVMSICESVRGERLIGLIESAGLKNSRALREKLRELQKNKSGLYESYLKRYEWWTAPDERTAAEALNIGPFTKESVGTIFAGIKKAAELSLNKTGSEMDVRLAKPAENIRYLKQKNGEFIIDSEFLSYIRYKCGMDGVYHLIAHEYLTGFYGPREIYPAVEKIMKALGKKACFKELSEAMELSGQRRERMRGYLEGKAE